MRIIGTSEAFESELLTYEKNCNAPGTDIDIKKLGVNPKLQIPRNQLPGNAPIVRPGAPDTRLQQNGNAPAIKLNNPNLGIKKHKLPNSIPAIKPTIPDSRLKQPQPSKSVPVLEPVLEKEKIPALKP